MTGTAPTHSANAVFLDALAPLLVRRFREDLYAHIQPACPVPVRDGTYPLLTALADGPATAAQVATRVGVDRTVITKQATILEDAGLLHRRPDPTDARGTLLELTPTGQHAARAIQQTLLALVEDLQSDGFSADDLHRAAAVLNALRDHAATHMTAKPTHQRRD